MKIMSLLIGISSLEKHWPAKNNVIPSITRTCTYALRYAKMVQLSLLVQDLLAFCNDLIFPSSLEITERSVCTLCSYVFIYQGMSASDFSFLNLVGRKQIDFVVVLGVFPEQILPAALSHLRCVEAVVLIKLDMTECNKSEVVITGKNEAVRRVDLGALLYSSPWMLAWPHLCHYSDK